MTLRVRLWVGSCLEFFNTNSLETLVKLFPTTLRRIHLKESKKVRKKDIHLVKKKERGSYLDLRTFLWKGFRTLRTLVYWPKTNTPGVPQGSYDLRLERRFKWSFNKTTGLV